MQNKLINTKYGEIEYRILGEGQVVLFLHGGHSNCNENLCHKGFDLDKYQVIIPSRPGYGRTPLGNNTTPRQAADLIAELLNYLAIDNVIVYGISAGGLTAIEFASNYSKKTKKLLLASAVSRKWLDEQGKIYKMAKRMFNPKNEKIIWGMIRIFSKIFPAMIAKNFYPNFSSNQAHKLNKHDINELIATFKTYNSKNGFLNDIDQNISDDTLVAISCPTLIIHSENDTSVLLEHATHANKMIKNSKIEVLQNEWGHLFWIGEDSGASIGKVLRFIEE